jgi:hypothetical protein
MKLLKDAIKSTCVGSEMDIKAKIHSLTQRHIQSNPLGPNNPITDDEVLQELKILEYIGDLILILLRQATPHTDQEEHGVRNRISQTAELLTLGLSSVNSYRRDILEKNKFIAKCGIKTEIEKRRLFQPHSDIENGIAFGAIIGVYVNLYKFFVADRQLQRILETSDSLKCFE